MPRIEITPRRLAAGLLVGAAAAALVLGPALGGALRRAESARHERLAVARLGALAAVVELSPTAAEARAAVADRSAAQTGLTALRWVDLPARSLEYSGLAADRAAGEPPRRLVRDEKALFDLAQKLRTAVEVNREEGRAREDEIDVERLEGGRLRIAVPIERSGAVAGFVQAETAQPPAPVAGSVLRRLGVGALPVAAMLVLLALLGRGSPSARSRAALAAASAIALAAGVLLASGAAAVDLRRAAERADREVAAAVTSSASWAAERLATAAAGLAPGRWDRDRLRRPLGRLDDAGAIDEAAVEAAGDGATRRLRRTGAVAATTGLVLLALVGLGGLAAFGRALRRYRVAYAYAVPALAGMLVLVFFPFLYGIALSFTNANIYNTDKSIPEIWIGLDNYREILGDLAVTERGEEGRVYDYRNFYWTLGFTVVWTISNVTIGVTLGLALALALNTRGLAGKPIYRVLLILPWAMPNYITSLIWKGMFHQQFGVVNQVVQIFGGQPVSWFEGPLTSFVTVLTTNGWLSFPFMMVISLGALQSIPADLYEAARVDGASRWRQFTSITLPLLKPALVPAIIISVIWTFNMFNIIYLVSQGEPGGATEILITEAYKIAFEQYRYGYAAAYSTVIFVILLAYGTWQNRVTRATEGI
jgi:arabinogalactan oligomer/maltooligosaccharide transport system permease protein